jgi:outer membrane lipoprotein-sorting protein
MMQLMNIVHRRPVLRAVQLATCAFAVLAVTNVAHADETLKKVDAAVNRWKTLDFSYKIVTRQPGAKPTTLKLRMRMRKRGGENQQMVEISEPADMDGTKILTASPTKMYIYMPSFGKVRRIASHVTEQGFLGTALSQRDLTLTNYSKYYDTTTTSDDASSVTLTLVARPGTDAPYPKIVLTANKSHWMPTEIRYFSDKGAHIKTETRKEYRCAQNYCVPKVQKLVDHTTKLESTLYLKKHKINPSIPDRVIAKRYLLR